MVNWVMVTDSQINSQTDIAIVVKSLSRLKSDKIVTSVNKYSRKEIFLEPSHSPWAIPSSSWLLVVLSYFTNPLQREVEYQKLLAFSMARKSKTYSSFRL